MLLMLSVVLAACGKPISTETVESLAANPDRLKTLREQCRLDRAKLGDELCNAVPRPPDDAYWVMKQCLIGYRLSSRSSKLAVPLAHG